MREKEVKQPRDVLVRLHDVSKQGYGAGYGERWLTLGHMVVQLGVSGAEDGSKQFELRYGGVERGQHEVPDAEEAQAGDGCGCFLRAKDEQEDLNDIVVALEVAQAWVSAEDVEYDIGQLLLPVIKLLV